MNFSNLIGNMMNTQKTTAAKDYTVAELLQEDFINNFTKFGSLDHVLTVATDYVVKMQMVKGMF